MSPDGLPYLRSRFTLPIVPLDEVKSWDDDSDDGNMSPVGYAPVLNASGALAEARRAFEALSGQHDYGTRFAEIEAYIRDLEKTSGDM